jgi:hypothetical protein
MSYKQFCKIVKQFPWVWGIFQDWTYTGYTKVELKVEKLGIVDPLRFQFSSPKLEDKRVWITLCHVLGVETEMPDVLERVGPVAGQTIAECILEKYKDEGLLRPLQLAISQVHNGNKLITIYRPGRGEYFPELVRESYKQYLKERSKLLTISP